MSKKICLAGPICSGKSTVGRMIVERTGLPHCSFGEIIGTYLCRNNLPAGREDKQKFGEELIARGYNKFVEWVIENSPQIEWRKPLIIDGLRYKEVYQALVKKFDTRLIYCACDEHTQLARLMGRDGVDEETARRILSHGTEASVREMEELADVVYIPGDPPEYFLDKIDVLTGR